VTNKSTTHLLQFIGTDHPHYQFLLCVVYNAILPLTYFDIGRKLAGFFSFAKSPSTPTIMRTLCRYVRQFDNYFEWFCLICTLYLFHKHPESQTDTTNLAAMVILISWANFMILQGQIPWFGVYVEMYVSVLKEFMLLLLAYVCLLIGYAISFYIIFKGDKAFSDPLKAIWKTLAMMTGELEYNDLFPADASDGMGIVSDLAVRLIFVTFLVTIAIVLMNLLVGIVVHDVNEIKSLALVTKLERKVVLVDYLSTTSENIKYIFKKAIDIIMVVPNYFCASRRQKYEPPADVADFFKVYVQPKDKDFDSEVKNAALQIALVNQEMHTLDAFGDSVDGPMSGQSHDTLENRYRRNNLKIKQLAAELFAATKDNEEILITLKSRK
jgi:Ion transport protein